MRFAIKRYEVPEGLTCDVDFAPFGLPIRTPPRGQKDTEVNSNCFLFSNSPLASGHGRANLLLSDVAQRHHHLCMNLAHGSMHALTSAPAVVVSPVST